MPSRKMSRGPLREIPNDNEFREPLREEYGGEENDSNFSRIMSQVDTKNLTVKVYEVKQPGDREFFLYNITNPTPEKMSEEAIRNQNGGRGGEFKIVLMVDGEISGSRLMLLNDSPNLAAAPVSGTMDSTQLILQKLAALEARMNTGGSNIPREPISDLVEAMVKMQQMNRPPETSVDTMLKFIELGKSIGGSGGDWKADLVSAVKEVAIAAAPAFNASFPPAPQYREPEPMKNAALPDPQATLIKVKENLSWLKNRIISGLTPDLAVEWLLTNRDSPEYQPFIAMALKGSIEDFVAVDAAFAEEPYRSWIESAIREIRTAYEQPSSDNDDSPGRDGNSGNASKNAPAGARKQETR